jgi:transcriptional regulator with XRE-family HTH domain
VPRSTPLPDWVRTERQRIGDRIRAARLYANLTQEKVSLATGIDRSSVNRIEQGHQAATIDTLLLIADAIGVDLAELVGK